MERDELLGRVWRLGEAFKARGMDAHARMLRGYWLLVRHGLAKGPKAQVQLSLDADAVDEWLRTLRVPPFDAAEGGYPVQRPGEGCRPCARSGDTPTVVTELIFPGGARMRCRTCGTRWLEDEGGRVAS